MNSHINGWGHGGNLDFGSLGLGLGLGLTLLVTTEAGVCRAEHSGTASNHNV